MMVFTGRAHPELAQRIVDHLGLPMGKAVTGSFSDGECMVELMENVRGRDVFIGYDFEDVMFRYEHATDRFFCKFVGKTVEVEVPFDDRLLNDAMRFGEEIDARAYLTGRLAND